MPDIHGQTLCCRLRVIPAEAMDPAWESDVALIRANGMATELAASIPAPAAVVNESGVLVFANEPLLELARAAGVEDVLGSALTEDTGAAAATDVFDVAAELKFVVQAVALRLRERVYSLVQLTLADDPADVGV